QHSFTQRPFEDPLELVPRGLSKLYSLWVRLTYPFASLGHNVSFHVTSKISRQRATRISLGNCVKVDAHAWLNVAGGEPSGQPTIIIEHNCIIAVGSIISAKNCIHLEDDVNIAQQVIIMDHNHAYEDIDVPIIHQG